MSNWINDGIWCCEQCDIEFKVYAKDSEPMINFCPSCGSRQIEPIDEE